MLTSSSPRVVRSVEELRQFPLRGNEIRRVVRAQVSHVLPLALQSLLELTPRRRLHQERNKNAITYWENTMTSLLRYSANCTPTPCKEKKMIWPAQRIETRWVDPRITEAKSIPPLVAYLRVPTSKPNELISWCNKSIKFCVNLGNWT
jgi:hypothetical protein